jgi:hypothetical protein
VNYEPCSSKRTLTGTLQRWVSDTQAEVTGRGYRHDPVLPPTGGPAGNAVLTAWTGALLLLLFLVELATLLDVHAFMSWHVVVGVLLVPPALLKTATTFWRFAGYYLRRVPYRTAGPPPMPLRVLGPLVVLSTLAVLGSGLALIALGPESSRVALFVLIGRPVTAVDLHKLTFVLWAGATGLHTLGRLPPALRIIASPPSTVPGWRRRAVAVAATLLVAGIAAAGLFGASGPWRG